MTIKESLSLKFGEIFYYEVGGYTLPAVLSQTTDCYEVPECLKEKYKLENNYVVIENNNHSFTDEELKELKHISRASFTITYGNHLLKERTSGL